MRQHLFTCELRLPRPLQQVFPFFADAANLGRITPPEMRFRILTPPPITMRAGTLIDYRIQLFGIPMRWCTRISVWDPPHEFVDEQLHGPYAEWVHRHSFAALPDGTTRMVDDVQYQLPLGAFGEIAHPFVRAQIGRIFGYRQRAILEVFTRTSPAGAGAEEEKHP